MSRRRLSCDKLVVERGGLTDGTRLGTSLELTKRAPRRAARQSMSVVDVQTAAKRLVRQLVCEAARPDDGSSLAISVAYRRPLRP